VEIHNTTANPHTATQKFARIIQLMRFGLHVLYIRTGPGFSVIEPAAMDKAFAFIDAASRDPSAPRQYGVIRGDGYVDISAARQFHQIAAIIIPEGFDKVCG
jgi:hypothetical protein